MGQARTAELLYKNKELEQKLMAYKIAYPEDRKCENCKYKYIVDSMTTECTNNYSPIDYIDEDCFPNFSCSEWSRK